MSVSHPCPDQLSKTDTHRYWSVAGMTLGLSTLFWTLPRIGGFAGLYCVFVALPLAVAALYRARSLHSGSRLAVASLAATLLCATPASYLIWHDMPVFWEFARIPLIVGIVVVVCLCGGILGVIWAFARYSDLDGAPGEDDLINRYWSVAALALDLSFVVWIVYILWDSPPLGGINIQFLAFPLASVGLYRSRLLDDGVDFAVSCHVATLVGLTIGTTVVQSFGWLIGLITSLIWIPNAAIVSTVWAIGLWAVFFTVKPRMEVGERQKDE